MSKDADLIWHRFAGFCLANNLPKNDILVKNILPKTKRATLCPPVLIFVETMRAPPQ